jgi:hypothetical protein
MTDTSKKKGEEEMSLTEKKEVEEWGRVIPRLLAAEEFYLCRETPQSAQQIIDKQGYFTDEKLLRLGQTFPCIERPIVLKREQKH